LLHGQDELTATQEPPQVGVRATGVASLPDAGQGTCPERESESCPDGPEGQALAIEPGEDQRKGEPDSASEVDGIQGPSLHSGQVTSSGLSVVRAKLPEGSQAAWSLSPSQTASEAGAWIMLLMVIGPCLGRVGVGECETVPGDAHERDMPLGSLRTDTIHPLGRHETRQYGQR